MTFQETEKTELKRILNESFEKEVDAFLNSFDGTIYIGVEDDGKVVGVDNIDKTMKDIADIITTKILPNPQEYVKAEVIFEKGKTIVAVNVKKGNALYYIKKYGRSAAGCYIRVGTTCRSMTEDQIEKAYIKTLNIPKQTINEKESYRQDLTFNEFKSILMIKQVHFAEGSFDINFHLKTFTGKYNYLAFLLSDQNDSSIKVCKFKGTTKVDFLTRKEFDDGCILRKMDEAFDYANNIINLIQTDVSGGKNRVDVPLLDSECLKEAWYNAVCHNLWIDEIPPAIYGFEDRVEIISQGTLRDDLTKEDFFNGISKPVNKDLADVFLKLHYMEQSGKGISTIVDRYGRNVFNFGGSYIQCILPFNIVDKEKYYSMIGKKDFVNAPVNSSVNAPVNKTEQLIINLMNANSLITYEELSKKIGKNRSTILRNIKTLKEKGLVERIGSDKSGKWKLNK